ncbi:MAG: hypothetical protein HKN80_00680 [Acidimicrobiia bacterium]|nr:hypothetical protein [Acidimicrobiia bacterium]
MNATSSPRPKALLRNSLALVVAIAVGFAVGRVTHSESGASGESAIAGKGGNQSGSAGSGRGPGSSPFFRKGPNALAQLRLAMDEPDPIAAAAMFSVALESLFKSEIAEASEEIWSTPGNSNETNERKRLLSYRWGQLDGPAAIHFAQSQSGAGKLTAITAALAGWASIDPTGAVAFINSQEHAGKRLLYTMALVDGWAREDVPNVTKHILSLRDDPQRDRMIKIVAGEQVRQDPLNAGPWALSLPDQGLREAAVDEVAKRLIWTEPEVAMEWAGGIEDPEVMAGAMDTAMATWTRKDPAAAGAYLSDMPGGPVRDRAVEAFSITAGEEDPQAGAEWAATISNPAVREQSLMAIARGWLKTNRKEALEWLPQSGLSPRAQTEVQSP